MLISVNDLAKYDVVAMDGEIGSIRGLYFDDSSWSILYFILDTGTWLPGRKVIVSTQSVARVDSHDKKIEISLARERIQNSPEVDEDEPLSLEAQSRIDAYYGWRGISRFSAHVQSTRDVIGSYIEANNGDIGHVEDFIIDSEGWVVRYMIVDTVNWWPGKKVLISPIWIQSMKWADKKVHIDLTQEQIKGSPEYTPGEMPARDYEERLYGHYRRPGYWSSSPDSSTRPPLA